MYFLLLFEYKFREKVIRSKYFRLNYVKKHNVYAHTNPVT